ncbi:MAG: glutamate formimidoyltransferase [Oscillospiraceae bacterium]|nr:glutamate formimidoyltransferase [Oscillospiraceae bacterium]
MTQSCIHYIIIFMEKLIECVPNFSEGRDMGVIAALRRAAEGISGVALLDYSSDPDHNRSVFTLLGSPDGVSEAAFRLCRVARDNIDMTRHSGAHPRMGAADVIPFIPIRGSTMDECVEVSRRVAGLIANELGIPCFLYGESCTREERRDLASVRRGGFEGMPHKLLQEEWAPDFGGRAIHPTAGVTAVGARKPLVAFNVNLGTPDVRAAKSIAKAIRGSSGGFAHCKAIGVKLESRGATQVSMNMVDCDSTPLHTVYEAICEHAARLGVPVTGSEIIGLAPADALIDCAKHFLKLGDFDRDRQVLESRILEL